MLQRMLAPVALMLLLSAGSASADYVQIKIDLNKLNFFPPPPAVGAGAAGGAAGVFGGFPQPGQPQPGQPQPGGMFGVMGGGIVQPPMNPEQGGTAGTPEQEPKWVSAFVEIKVTKTSNSNYGPVYTYDHKWGRNNWLLVSPALPMVAGRIEKETFTTAFHQKLDKEKKVNNKSAEKYLPLARLALSHGQLKEFHKAMKEAVQVEPKHPTVVNYVRVQKALAQPLKTFDPAQAELIEELRSVYRYKPHLSDQGHYCLYAPSASETGFSEALIKRRLNLMEETLECFYYWFAVQKDSPPQPAFPKHRLLGVLSTTEQFITNHVKWGSELKVADGFTPRRDNLIVLSLKSRVNDPNFHEFEKLLNQHLLDANTKLSQFKLGFSQEDLLSGRINEIKAARDYAAVYIAAAQTAVLLRKTMEDEAERATISHEVVRQLIIASEMLPRNVQVPEWMIEGLASMFETPIGAVHATTGAPSYTHLISFKHLIKTKKISDKASDVLFGVVTDRYFTEARQIAAEAQDNRDNDTLKARARQAEEIARSTAWAYVYYLAKNSKLEYLFRYGKELDKLPRDMDLDGVVLQSVFARAFDMTDPKDARRIERVRLSVMAEGWFSLMQSTSLDFLMLKNATTGQQVAIEAYLLDQRASLDVDPAAMGGVTIQPAIPGGNPRPPIAGTTPPVANPTPKVDPVPKVDPPVTNPPPMTDPPMTEPAPANPPGGGKAQPKQPSRKPAPLPPMNNPPPPDAPPTPPAGNPATDMLVNTTWSGQENLKGYGTLSFSFQPNNQVTMTDKDGQTPGTYQVQNNTVRMAFGPVTYMGTINGSTMTGSGRNPGTSWTFTVRR